MPDNESNRVLIERPAPRHFRIFLSSPGDVWEERELARKLIKEKLPYRPFLRDRVTFDVVSWDDPHARTPMLGTLTPQECVNRFGPKPSDCDIVVVLFWARMGTPLPESYRKASGERYLSGTEWEYEDAIHAAGSLDLLIYRRTGVPLLRYGDPKRVEKQRQLDLVEQFFEKFRAADGSLLRLFKAYDAPAEFEKLLADDLERILRLHLDADEAKRALRLRQREEELAERERVLQDREAAIDALVAEAKTPKASVAIETALRELTAGDATRAKAVFAEVLDRKAAESSAAAREAAAAARHLGTLAMLDDTLEALRAFRWASELDPTDTWTWIHISRLESQKGDLRAAEAAVRQARRAAERAGNERDVAVADGERGDVLVGQGRLADALTAFEAYRATVERLAESDPGNADWQRDLSVSHNKIGDVLWAQGNLTAALESH